MLKMATGQSEELDGENAAAEILKQCADGLGSLQPQAGLLLASHDLDLEDFLAAVKTAYPSMGLLGCTTVAPMSSVANYVEGSTTLPMFASDVLDFTTGLGRDVAADARGASRRAVEEAANRTDKDPALLVVAPTAESFDPAVVAIEMSDMLGPTVPILGGGAVPDYPVTAPWTGGMQFFGDEVTTDSPPVFLVSGPLIVSVGVAHGWTPVGSAATITRADDETVYEIDGAPVLDFYRHYLGAESFPAVGNPLAILDEDTGRYYLRAPLAYDQSDGSATFLGSIPEGATVKLAMATTGEIPTGTDVSVGEAMAGYLEESAPEGALVVSCAVLNILLGTQSRKEIERIRAGVGQDLPVAGFCSYGEIAPLGPAGAPRFHNETCVTVLIGT